MATYKLVAIKNEIGERKLIREDDFDPEEHEKWDADQSGSDEKESKSDKDAGDNSGDSGSGSDEDTGESKTGENSGDSGDGSDEDTGDEDSSDEGSGEGSEEEPQRQFGDFKAVENEKSPGWWNVINVKTQEIQNNKNLREDDAIARAKELDANA